MNKPGQLVFYYTKQDASVTKCLDDQGWERLDDGHWAAIYDLQSEANHFFCLEKPSQLKALAEFVAKAYDQGRKCLVVAPPPLPPP